MPIDWEWVDWRQKAEKEERDFYLKRPVERLIDKLSRCKTFCDPDCSDTCRSCNRFDYMIKDLCMKQSY